MFLLHLARDRHNKTLDSKASVKKIKFLFCKSSKYPMVIAKCSKESIKYISIKRLFLHCLVMSKSERGLLFKLLQYEYLRIE